VLEAESVGQLIQRARLAKGLTLEALAKELKLPIRHLEAIEGDHWAALPPGRPRPLARQLAARLEVDLEYHTGAFQIVPGVRELEPPDPRQERLERVVMGLLSAASVAVVLWLVVPGPRLGRKPPPSYLTSLARPMPPPPPPPTASAYPVLGELLPESPINEQGILVSLRSMGECPVRIEPQADLGGQVQVHTLRVSEPWRLRVKGPFTLILDDAGVVNVEVAGRRIAHGRSVGEPWTGQFDGEGRWLQPKPPALPAAAPVRDDDEDGPRP
jgi:transcriptional regulator with XRE-family HTH domain